MTNETLLLEHRSEDAKIGQSNSPQQAINIFEFIRTFNSLNINTAKEVEEKVISGLIENWKGSNGNHRAVWTLENLFVTQTAITDTFPPYISLTN